MTGPVLQSAASRHAHAPPLAHNQLQLHTDATQLACCASSAMAAAPAPRSAMDGWFRKLRLHSAAPRHRSASSSRSSGSSTSSNNSSAMGAVCETHKRKQPSFIKTLFQPHELKAVGNVRADASASASSRQDAKSHRHRQSTPERSRLQQQKHEQQPRVTPPVEIPSTYMGRDFHGAMTVGGQRVPFTRDAHRRSHKKHVKVLASISELHAVPTLGSASMQAYRSRAYYQPPASKASSRKDKR